MDSVTRSCYTEDTLRKDVRAMKSNRVKIHLLSLGILIAGFVLSILIKSDRTGIGGTGKFLALFALVMVACSFLMGGKAIPLLTSSGYFISFLFAFFFQRERINAEPCHTNNFGGLWIIAFFTLFIVSIFLESVYANQKLSN